MAWESWQTVLVDLCIPLASILIPTGIAIWLARQERNAASQQRAADLERSQKEHDAAEARLAAEARRRAVEAALASMSDLVRAAFTTDPLRDAELRVGTAARIAAIRLDLTKDEDPVFSWINREVAVVAQALNDREPDPEPWLPVAGDKITWRAGTFAQVLTDWVTGEKDIEWFASDPALPIEATEKPGD